MTSVYPRTAIIVPIRGFSDGKTRLAPYLCADRRAQLGRLMATGLIRACEGLPVLVISSADEVLRWARQMDVGVLPDPGSLDAAAAAGVEWARSQWFARAVVAHADLPYATHLRSVLTGLQPGRDDAPGLIAVAGHRDHGSPVMSIPTRTDFRFSYGPGSLRRHLQEARRLGMPVRLERDTALEFDLDTIEDLQRVSADLDTYAHLVAGQADGRDRIPALTGAVLS